MIWANKRQNPAQSAKHQAHRFPELLVAVLMQSRGQSAFRFQRTSLHVREAGTVYWLFFWGGEGEELILDCVYWQSINECERFMEIGDQLSAWRALTVEETHSIKQHIWSTRRRTSMDEIYGLYESHPILVLLWKRKGRLFHPKRLLFFSIRKGEKKN